MAPLILHNVPDDECYVGEDGVKRPYAMIFNGNDGHTTGSTRSRRYIAETGSFGKSTRRSRSRTGTTPARGRENPTLAAADKLFGDWVSNQAAKNTPATNNATTSGSNTGNSNAAVGNGISQQDDASAQPAVQRAAKSHPVEMILRGYRSSVQQYAAISHYEALAGIILEDYPRDPPADQRRWKSELRDPAFTRRRTLNPNERSMVNRVDGGEHWVKVTFSTQEAAEAASFASPQRILGHLIYAEPYRGMPPAKDEACVDTDSLGINGHGFGRSASTPALNTPSRKSFNNMPSNLRARIFDDNSPQSRTSSQTLDSGTVPPSSSTINGLDLLTPGLDPLGSRLDGGEEAPVLEEDDLFYRGIPTARKVKLLPAELALLPQQTLAQSLINAIPFVKRFGGSMIGNEIPRTEMGEFDWNRASLYWKIMWWLDATFGLFRGEVSGHDKDD